MTVLGLGSTIANLNRIASQIVLSQEEGLVQAGEVIRQAWVDNIEEEGLVDTGRYRDSIRVGVDGGEVAVYTDVEYANILEFGSSYVEPHPAAEQAVDEHGEKAIGVVGDHIGRVIR